jgi:DNA-directed RNA polymerase specialized sigma24 family protein
MPEAKPIARPTPYASSADFCRIFDEDMNDLYLLSFLLTADREKAEQCFVSGLEDAVEGNPVFKEWARSWARRVIIQNAVRAINPRPVERRGSSRSTSVDDHDQALPPQQQVEMAGVLELEPFDRFVYVMTVLERYSDHECSLLLSCARREVLAARTRALQQLGSAMELHYKLLPNAKSQSSVLRERSSSVFELLVAPHLVTSA